MGLGSSWLVDYGGSQVLIKLTAPRRPIAVLLAAACVVSAFGASVAIAASACTPPAANDDISLMDENELKVFNGRACNSRLESYEKYFIPFDENGLPLTPIKLTHRETASTGGPDSRRRRRTSTASTCRSRRHATRARATARIGRSTATSGGTTRRPRTATSRTTTGA